MNVFVNQQPQALPDAATLADALHLLQPAPPFAVAVNRVFVPRGTYAQQPLQEGDSIEIIAPITGG